MEERKKKDSTRFGSLNKDEKDEDDVEEAEDGGKVARGGVLVKIESRADGGVDGGEDERERGSTNQTNGLGSSDRRHGPRALRQIGRLTDVCAGNDGSTCTEADEEAGNDEHVLRGRK